MLVRVTPDWCKNVCLGGRIEFSPQEGDDLLFFVIAGHKVQGRIKWVKNRVGIAIL